MQLTDRTKVLKTCCTEQEAAIIVAVLADEGVEAFTTGGMMTQNRFLVPGYVQVLVSASDVETAQAILNERRAPATGVETSAEEPEVRRRIDRFWVVVAIVFLGAILTRAIVDFWHF